MTGRYAVVWSDGGPARTGRLDVGADRLELHGRDGELSVRFVEVAEVAFGRGAGARLLGMPVLVLH
jgi:hypothetical protein